MFCCVPRAPAADVNQQRLIMIVPSFATHHLSLPLPLCVVHMLLGICSPSVWAIQSMPSCWYSIVKYSGTPTYQMLPKHSITCIPLLMLFAYMHTICCPTAIILLVVACSLQSVVHAKYCPRRTTDAITRTEKSFKFKFSMCLVRCCLYHSGSGYLG